MLYFSEQEMEVNKTDFVNSVMEENKTVEFCRRANVMFHVLRNAFGETSIGYDRPDYTENILRSLLGSIHNDFFELKETGILSWSTGRVTILAYFRDSLSLEFLIEIGN